MPIARAQIIFPYDTNLPTDVAVNVLHFAVDTPDADEPLTLAQAEDVMDAAWDFVAGGTSADERIGAMLSAEVQGTFNIKVYDVGAPKFTPPLVNEIGANFQSDPAGNSLPHEVALVGSFRASPIGGVPPAQLRGRVFIGPLNTTCSTASGQPSTIAQTRLLSALGRLIDRSPLNPSYGVDQPHFGIWSRPKGPTLNKDGSPNPARPGTFHYAHDAWVDNAFDTQRRRGRAATSRVTVDVVES